MDIDLAPLVDRFRETHSKVERELADPAVFGNRQRLETLGREHQRLSALLKLWDQWQRQQAELAGAQELLAGEKDPEFRAVIEGEIATLERTGTRLQTQVMGYLVPEADYDTGSVIIEIRPAAGGDEAALFAAELLRAYMRYAETRGWKLELLEKEDSDLGGLRHVMLSVVGEGVVRALERESGVHRVQRVPVTEGSGRIHTSTVTVAIMPEPREVDVQINPADLDITVCRASGAGGQHVNKTDSAVRMVHRPSGIVVASQQERSQIRNREIALRMLRAKLLEMKIQEETSKYAAQRKSQVGTGDRSERIRTWNFPQNRVTDHRYGLSWHNLPGMLEGELDDVIDQIQAIDHRQRLEAELKKL